MDGDTFNNNNSYPFLNTFFFSICFLPNHLLPTTSTSAMTNQEAYERIIKGYRMPAPPKCPNFLYEIMLKCWSARPVDRPDFKQIKKQLDSSSFELE